MAKETVRIVADILARGGIAVMPLKGALLQRLVYGDPFERDLTDVDALVLPRTLGAAGAILTSHGFARRSTSRSGIASAFTAPTGMVLDLHDEPFGPARYDLRTGDLFARSTCDEKLFDAPIRLMAPVDLYAHLIGKLVTDHADRRQTRKLEDLVRVPDRLALDPSATAAHLVGCGMRRAARYAMEELLAVRPHPFTERALAELPSDTVGRVLAASARSIIRRTRPFSPVGAVPAHLLNHSLPRAGLAVGAAALARVRRATRRE